MVKLLSEKDKVSEKTDLGVAIYVYTDGTEAKAIWSTTPFGVSEYTKEGSWIPVAPQDPRVLDLQDLTLYKLDWSNDKDFDEEGESKALELYTQGQLTEDYLQENAIFLRDPISGESQ